MPARRQDSRSWNKEGTTNGTRIFCTFKQVDKAVLTRGSQPPLPSLHVWGGWTEAGV